MRLIADLESYAQELEGEADRLEANPIESLSPNAMEVSGEPTGGEAAAALKIEIPKDSGNET